MERDKFSVYVDFDSTLFHTRRFADDLRRLIARQANITYEQFHADEEAHIKNSAGYSILRHAASYGIAHAQILESVRTLVGEHDYLFTDSAAFIHGLRQDGLYPRILTFGEAAFQTAKIEPNLTRLFGEGESHADYVVVSRPKTEYIAETHPGLRGALVDDVPNQHLPGGFTEIHLDRTTTLPEPKLKPGGYVVSDLGQALQLIRTLE